MADEYEPTDAELHAAMTHSDMPEVLKYLPASATRRRRQPNVGEQAVLDLMRGTPRTNYVENPMRRPSITTPLDDESAEVLRQQMAREHAQILMEVPDVQVTPPSRPTVHEWALGLALAVSARADCTRRQVGAVILDPENRVISTGYNGYPAGAPGCLTQGACPRGRLSYAQVPADSPYVGTDAPCGALHAEENAVLYARRDLRGCVLYCTHKPCPNCERLLRGTGLASVVWAEGSLDLTA